MFCNRFQLALLSLAASRFTRAVPVPRAQQCVSPGANEALGAVYFLTNGERMNEVVSALINPDGTLSFASRQATGGKGGSGTVSPPAARHPDSLFSQHSVVVAGNTLHAVNAGSNTISMFTIDPQDPSQLTLVAQEPSGGEFPVALAATPDASTVCALNSAGKGTVRCFAASAQNGLTPMPGSDIKDLGVNQTCPPVGPLSTVSDILFSGENLVVSVKGTSPQAPGNLALFTTKKSGQNAVVVDPTNPQRLAAKGGVAPFGFSAALDGSGTLFVTDAGFGVSTFALPQGAGGNVAASGKASSSITKINGQVATCWSAQSKVTGSFFSTDIGTSQITEFQVKGDKSTQIKAYDLQKGNTTDEEVASTKNGDFLYSLLPGTTSIGALAVGTKPGNVKLLQNLDLSSNVPGINQGMIGMATFVKK